MQTEHQSAPTRSLLKSSDKGFRFHKWYKVSRPKQITWLVSLAAVAAVAVFEIIRVINGSGSGSLAVLLIVFLGAIVAVPWFYSHGFVIDKRSRRVLSTGVPFIHLRSTTDFKGAKSIGVRQNNGAAQSKTGIKRDNTALEYVLVFKFEGNRHKPFFITQDKSEAFLLQRDLATKLHLSATSMLKRQ